MNVNKFKATRNVLVCCILPVLFTSCLKRGLPAYPRFGSAYIDRVYFQYRWLDSSVVSNGSPVVAVKNMAVAQQIDSANNTITCQITVPAASGDFNAYQRNRVSLDSIWMTVDISPAATLVPVGNAPNPAYQGDYSMPRQYQVTAADPSSSKVWTIKVTSFAK